MPCSRKRARLKQYNMEKLHSIKQLEKGRKIFIFGNCEVKQFEFVCFHPKNEEYIIVLDKYEDPVRLYLPSMIGRAPFWGEVYVGEWDQLLIMEKLLSSTYDKLCYFRRQCVLARKKGGEE